MNRKRWTKILMGAVCGVMFMGMTMASKTEARTAFVCEGRIGNAAINPSNPLSGDFEYDIGTNTAAPYARGQFGWLSSNAVPFTVIYDANARLARFQLGSGEVMFPLNPGDFLNAPDAVANLNFRLRAIPTGSNVTLTNLILRVSTQPGATWDATFGPAHGNSQILTNIPNVTNVNLQGGFRLDGDAIVAWDLSNPPARSQLAFQISADEPDVTLDLDIDSDNNNGIDIPSRNADEEAMETASPGKFVFVNRNDDDEDGVPDYADAEVVSEGNLVPLVLEVRGVVNWEQVAIELQYPGPETVDFNDTIDLGSASGLTCYTNIQQNVMRIWRETSTGSLEFLAPTNHTAVELGLSASNNQLALFVEGINAAATTNIVAIVTQNGVELGRDIVTLTIVAPNIGVNNSNDVHDFDPTTQDDLRPGVPDVEFEIDERDEMVEDQGGGFQFWWSRDNNAANPSAVTMDSIVDIAPFVVDVSQHLLDAGFTFYLRADGADLYAYPAASPSTNRRRYLQQVGTANDQLGRAAISLPDGAAVQIEITAAGRHEFVFKAVGSGESSVTLSLVIQEPVPSVNQVVADSVVLTFRDTDAFWHFVSSRLPTVQTNPNIAFTYDVEDGRAVQMNRYPYAVVVPGSGARDPNRRQHLIWMHGYANSLNVARSTYNEMFRRIYWLGFRGNFIGFAWHSDEGQVPHLAFDTQVQNALQTSPSLRQFLAVQVPGWGVPAQNVNLISHSLGNLVVFDALRLQRQAGAGLVINNVASLESATWPEAYYYETIPPNLGLGGGGIRYPSPPNAPAHAIYYPINVFAGLPPALKQHSWAFWFGQANNEVPGVVNGGIYHSFLPTDPVLAIMRLNDWEQRGLFAPPFTRWWHYQRKAIPGVNAGLFRQPSDLAPQPRLYDAVPTLMLVNSRVYGAFGPLGIFRYLPTHLNLPVGTMPNAMPIGNMFNYPAANGGWLPPANQADLNAHSRYVQQPFPSLYNWFRIFLAGDGDLNSGEPDYNPVFPIGEE